MLFTASTVLDSRANVEFFVHANLSMGVDHMVVFLDAPLAEGQPEVREWLESEPHVTVVPAGKRWWGADRPRSLNVRQRVNANLLASVLADQPWASWVFHLDGDEVFAGDRDVLEAVPAGIDSAWLAPLEAVSEFEPAHRPTRFKHLLHADDLNLLQVLGLVEHPSNSSYFHGHVRGKSGIRPSSDLRLTLHEAVDSSGRPAERAEDPRLSVLHYDAVSGAEFVRKWTAMLGAGPAGFRANRAPVADALRALVAKDLSPEVAQRHLRRIYETTTQDDVVTLAELGLLVTVDPTQGSHTPQALSQEHRTLLDERLRSMAGVPKRHFDADKLGAKAPGQPERHAGRSRRQRLGEALRHRGD